MDTPPRILVVDDEENQRRTLAIALRLEGYDVLEAADGFEALRVLQGTEVDLAVVDLMMPGLDGLGLARWMRFRAPEVPVFLVSAYRLSDRQLDRAQVEVRGFVPKPFRVDDLAARVSRELEGRRAATG